MQKGLIIKAISGEYKIITDEREEFVCKPRGLFRYKEKTPKVGDIVDFDLKTRIILRIHPRRNELDRPIIANLDKAFLTFSVREPDLNLNLLDRLISIVEYNDIEIVIVLQNSTCLRTRVSSNRSERTMKKSAIGYIRAVLVSPTMKSKRK